MKHEIIKTDNYLLVVDESEIKVGDWYYVPRTNKAYKCEYDPTELEMEKRFGVRKVIAHLPLNGSPILEGVVLLPPLEDDVEKLALDLFPRHENWTLNSDNAEKRPIWVDGYNQAKEKYKYTEEDLRKAWNAAYIDAMSIDEETYKPLFFEDFIQSLSQPKMPIGFERELVNIMGKGEPITERNSQGHIQWVGTYIYE